MLTAKWQALVIDWKVNRWMEWHMEYVNVVPFRTLAPTAQAKVGALDPQTCFDKAMDDTITALTLTLKGKKYSITELQHLQVACSLTVAKMTTNLVPKLYQSLLTEGQSNRGTEESVLANALRPTADNDNRA
jgi:hypothetical protein